MSPHQVRAVFLEVLAVGLPVLVIVLAAQGKAGFPLVSALCASAVLPLRHRWPRSVVVLCLPALGGGLGWAPAIVAEFAFGRAQPRFSRTAPWVALATASAVIPVLVMQSLNVGQIVLAVSFSLLGSGTPVALGALVTTRHQLTESLRRLREAREAELHAKAETARAEERARIAREIHDAVGHHATLIAVEAAALDATSRDPDTKKSASRMRELAKAALAEMRTTLGLATAERTQPAGLPDIPDLVARVRDSGVDVRLYDHIGPAGGPAPSAGRAAYRVVQEALTNASKHAPGAPVRIHLEDCEDSLQVTVVNGARTGHAVDIGHGGSGLAGLSERVRMAGGELHTERSAAGDFELRVLLPTTSRRVESRPARPS